jgi:hypothetical protein
MIIERLNNGMHIVRLDEETLETLGKLENNRIICTLQGKVSFHCALLTQKETGPFVYVSSAVCRQLDLKPGLRVYARFEPDTTPYQYEMPEALQAVLESDGEADRIFHTLTPGNQRGLMVLVTQVKSREKQLERALRICTSLKNGVTSAKAVLKNPPV